MSDREGEVENQIKGEGHLWCTLPADTALRKQFKMFFLVKVRPVLLRLHVIKRGDFLQLQGKISTRIAVYF